MGPLKALTRVFLLTAVSVFLLVGTPAAEEKGSTDIVFAIDISRSMLKNKNFGKVRARLIEFIQKEVGLGGHIAIVTFGNKAKLLADRQINSQKDKSALINTIKSMKANASHTYMASGIDVGLQSLRELSRKYTDSGRMLVLLTDGKNDPPKSIPEDRKLTFEKLREKYSTIADFKQGVNWFFWYCFIGKPDKDVQKFVESMGGESKPLTGRWRFYSVKFNRAVIKLGKVPSGYWTREFPTPADRQLGETFRATTRTPGQYTLEFSDVILDGPGKAEKVTVSPRAIPMKKKEQSIILKFDARNMGEGERRGRVMIRSPGKMVFVSPQQFHVVFTSVSPVVDVKPKEGLDFGRIFPGKFAERSLELSPDEMAKRAATGKTTNIILPKDLPRGIALSVQPDRIPLDKKTSVLLKLSAAPDAVIPEQPYKGIIAFSPVAGISFKPQELPIAFKGSVPTIRVVGAPEVWAIDHWPAVSKREAELPLVLRANRAASGTRVSLSSSGDGDDPGEEIQIVWVPGNLKVAAGQNTLLIKVTVAPPDAFLDRILIILFGGSYHGKILLNTDSPGTLLKPDGFEWKITLRPLVLHNGLWILILAVACACIFLWWPRRVHGQLVVEKTRCRGCLHSGKRA